MDKISTVIRDGERLYRLINPKSKMDVPSYFYEKLEKEYDEWKASGTVLSFYLYCYNKIKQNEKSEI